MSLFPIKVTRETLHYQRGSSDKEYHFLQIETSDNRAILGFRFGKSGTWGTLDTQFGTPVQLWRSYNKKHSEKTRKGYEMVRRDEDDIEDLSALKSCLGAYWNTLRPQIESYFGLAVVEGSPPPAEPPAPPPSTEAERYKNNPLYGAF